MAMPFGKRPASSVSMTAGGEDLRSITEILLSCVIVVASAAFGRSFLDRSHASGFDDLHGGGSSKEACKGRSSGWAGGFGTDAGRDGQRPLEFWREQAEHLCSLGSDDFGYGRKCHFILAR